MPVHLSAPGVYVQEIPSGLHTITGVATSICAFVGAAPRGPVNVPNEIFSFGEFEAIFGGLTLDSAGVPWTLGFAVRDFFQNGGDDAIVVRVEGTEAKTAGITDPLGGVLKLTAASSGTWGNNLFAQADTLITRDPKNAALFNLTIAEFIGGQQVRVERFQNLSTDPTDPKYVIGYLAANSGLVRATKPTGNFPTGKSFPDPPAVPPVVPPVVPPTPVAVVIPGFTAFSDAKDAAPGTVDVIGDENTKTGIFALDGVDIFNMLVLPAVVPIIDAAALSKMASTAADYCKSRRAMYIMDPPESWFVAWSTNTATALPIIVGELTKLHGPSSSYTAVYFPRLIEPNPLKKFQPETFAAGGAIAGIFARTDAARGVWKAPAGLEAAFSGVLAPSHAITNAQNGKLNEIGVNCLRTFPLAGNVVWGSRTMDGADVLESEYKYVPVRRFTLFLEESLFRGTQWVVFEPNAEPLWSQIRLNVGAFMHELFRQGAFAGVTPQAAYFVQCDAQTTTQNDIDSGIVNILVGFAPLKPAEFVILKIQQMTGQIAV